MKKLSEFHRNILAIAMILMLLCLAVIDTMFNTSIFSVSMYTVTLVPLVSLAKTPACNMAGVATIVYVIPLDDIAAFPSIGALVTPADLVKYVGDFSLNANKYWYTLYSTKEMGELIAETDGPTDGKFFRGTVTAFHPRTSEDAVGLATTLKDRDVVVIVKEVSSGKLRVIGTSDIPATVSPSENSGKAYSDEKGITFTFEAASCKAPMFYYGSVVTENEVVYAPVRLAVDATTLDYSLGSRVVVGANTASKILASVTNMSEGDVLRIEFDALSAESLAFSGAFGATATIDAAGEWFEITKFDTTTYIITGGDFA